MRTPHRRPAGFAIAALFVVLLAACTGPGGSGAPGSGSPAATPPASAGAGTGITGHVTAGPTCPVERPGDSACAERPVAGAVLLVQAADKSEVGRVTSAADGAFRLDLPPGSYTIMPQPVEGVLGTASSTDVTVTAGTETPVDISYDTGIR